MSTVAFNPKDTPLPLAFFLRKYGLSRTTFWRYERKGLPVLKVGGKTFCRESDFVAFLERAHGHQPSSSDNQPAQP
jgi:hypothetical protein